MCVFVCVYVYVAVCVYSMLFGYNRYNIPQFTVLTLRLGKYHTTVNTHPILPNTILILDVYSYLHTYS